MDIKGIKGFEETLLDYPGHPAIIVYFHGCEFRCPFCHNVGLVTREDDPDISWPKFKGEVTSRVNLVEAVVASGGEPTLNPGLSDFFGWMKELELLTKLDTNGSRPEVLGRLLAEGFLDYVAMDVKHVLEPKRYAEAIGLNVGASRSLPAIASATAGGRPRGQSRAAFEISLIRESMDAIRRSGVDYEFRTTVAPGLHKKEDIVAIARQLQGAKKYVLQQFIPRGEHVSPAFAKKEKYPAAELRAMAEECSKYVSTEVRGVKV